MNDDCFKYTETDMSGWIFSDNRWMRWPPALTCYSIWARVDLMNGLADKVAFHLTWWRTLFYKAFPRKLVIPEWSVVHNRFSHQMDGKTYCYSLSTIECPSGSLCVSVRQKVDKGWVGYRRVSAIGTREEYRKHYRQY